MSQIYAKDSLDRFGDDLCQHLLSFLSFEDRFRCECLSKQWQRVIHSTHTRLKLFGQYSQYFNKNNNLSTFETIVKKCANIKSIEFRDFDDISNEMMTIITKYCHNLSELCIDCKFGGKRLDFNTFFALNANKLTTINITVMSDHLVSYFANKLKLCANVRKITLSLNCHLDGQSLFAQLFCADNQIHWKSLEEFGLTFSANSDGPVYLGYISTFVAKYGLNLRSFHVRFEFNDEESDDDLDDSDDEDNETQTRTLLQMVSQMTELSDLQIITHCRDIVSTEDFITGLTQIGTNCRKLVTLEMGSIYRYIHICHTMNTYFTQLKRLIITSQIFVGFNPIVLNETLNGCKRLTHLKVDVCGNCLISEHFLTNICENSPKLQFLWLSKTEITDVSLNSLSKLTKLQTIRLVVNGDIQRSIHETIVNNCPKIKEIEVFMKN